MTWTPLKKKKKMLALAIKRQIQMTHAHTYAFQVNDFIQELTQAYF